MAWIQDYIYSFSVAVLYEGLLKINSLTINGINMIVGGVDQAVTPLVHPGAIVSISMVVKNEGQFADDFKIEVYKGGTLYSTSPTIPALAINSTASYSPATFVMPSTNVPLEIRTFHFE